MTVRNGAGPAPAATDCGAREVSATGERRALSRPDHTPSQPARASHVLRREWPLVILKELLDNAVDACEESGTALVIRADVTERAITVSDNGPGLPAETVAGILDFAVRVSSREGFRQLNAVKARSDPLLLKAPIEPKDAFGAVRTTFDASHHITLARGPPS